ncbi:MmcQ/YjbR family DNA-binding protein [Bosea sp. 124]|uniref:MmcQ/YjbR family DNA-binding protein n=1 Tax=Bosea sp. 124 TaxID=2135642 RepID=UPI000D38063F|nr:MmcQ/YjbR family DNA-binding protein [Bosea sp. 124]PTM43053.1 putative DNA-binding protein (MmcQ/YjbR family) [Bosea sp. 124]
MTLDGYTAFCAALPATHMVVQWGGAHVWKVGDKVFAIARTDDGVALSITFKCSWASFDILKEQPGLRPAPYLASRGMSWIQRLTDEAMPDAALQDYLRESHRLVAGKLTRRVRAELGLDVQTSSRRL